MFRRVGFKLERKSDKEILVRFDVPENTYDMYVLINKNLPQNKNGLITTRVAEIRFNDNTEYLIIPSQQAMKLWKEHIAKYVWTDGNGLMYFITSDNFALVKYSGRQDGDGDITVVGDETGLARMFAHRSELN